MATVTEGKGNDFKKIAHFRYASGKLIFLLSLFYLLFAYMLFQITPGTQATFTATTSNKTNSFQTATLSPPTSLGSTAGLDRVDLSWTITPSNYASGYNLYRSTTSGSGYTLVASITGRASTTYTDASVNAGTTYYYILRAYYLAWESVNSNQTSATPFSNLTITSVALQSISNPAITTTTGWLGSGRNYQVIATVTDSGATVTSVTANLSIIGGGVAVAMPGSGTYTSAVLTAGAEAVGTYSFSVTAKDSAGSTVTLNGTVSIDNTNPTPPGGIFALAGGGVGSGVVTITGVTPGADTGGSGLAGYVIYVSSNGGVSYTVAGTTAASSTSFNYNGTSGKTYSFYVVSVDNAANISAASNKTTVVAP